MSQCARVAAVKITGSRSLGAVFLFASFLNFAACKKAGTPEWASPSPPAASEVSTPISPKSRSAKKQKTPAGIVQETAIGTPGTLRFITYNVKNWLTMERRVGDRDLVSSKPASEKRAVVQLLVRQTPDVIGLCEVGTVGDLAEIQQDLKAAGLDLPHSHHTGGSDLVRHLGFLSRFPITATSQPAEMEYRLAGRTFAINRGILDATVEAHGRPYRFVGVHLKSKRDSQQGDQEAIRFHEARLLRSHLDTIFLTDSEARLIVYGDFNDSRSSPALKAIMGKYRDPDSLIAIPAKDSQNHMWTHCWEIHDIYSRFDYILVTQALRPAVDFDAAKIIDDKDWSEASDHRAVSAVFH